MRRPGSDRETAEDGGNRVATTISAERRAGVAVARQLARRCRASLRDGEARYPAGDWACREREALDALRVLAVFLENHPGDPVA